MYVVPLIFRKLSCEMECPELILVSENQRSELKIVITCFHCACEFSAVSISSAYIQYNNTIQM